MRSVIPIFLFTIICSFSMSAFSADDPEARVLERLPAESAQVCVEKPVIDGKEQDPILPGFSTLSIAGHQASINYCDPKIDDTTGTLSSQVGAYVARRLGGLHDFRHVFTKSTGTTASVYLTIKIEIIHPAPGLSPVPLAMYHVDLSLREPVTLRGASWPLKGNRFDLPAATWSRSRMGCTAKDNEFEAIKKAIAELVTEFDEAYEKATPVIISGSGDSTRIMKR